MRTGLHPNREILIKKYSQGAMLQNREIHCCLYEHTDSLKILISITIQFLFITRFRFAKLNATASASFKESSYPTHRSGWGNWYRAVLRFSTYYPVRRPFHYFGVFDWRFDCLFDDASIRR